MLLAAFRFIAPRSIAAVCRVWPVVCVYALQYVSTLRSSTKGRANYSMQLSKYDFVPQVNADVDHAHIFQVLMLSVVSFIFIYIRDTAAWKSVVSSRFQFKVYKIYLFIFTLNLIFEGMHVFFFQDRSLPTRTQFFCFEHPTHVPHHLLSAGAGCDDRNHAP